MAKKKTAAKKSKPKKQKKSSSPSKSAPEKNQPSGFFTIIVIAFLILTLVIVGSLLYIFYGGSSSDDVVAIVNDREVTVQELDSFYTLAVPVEYHSVVSRQAFLNDTLIPHLLLLEQVEKQGITLSDEEVDSSFDESLALIGQTPEEFEAQLAAQGISLDEIKLQYKDQLLIGLYLNQTIFSEVEVGADDIMEAYSTGGFEEQGFSLGEVAEFIEEQLLFEQQGQATEEHIQMLTEQAEIVIIQQELPTAETSFSRLEFCDHSHDVRMYTSSKCTYCKQVGNRLAQLLEDTEGFNVAFWELDTGDNILTPEVEEGIPAEELALFKSLSVNNTIPTYIIGCEYRVGHLDNAAGNLNAEEKEFRDAIARS